jgi:iron complex outermembrane recepter protein
VKSFLPAACLFFLFQLSFAQSTTFFIRGSVIDTLTGKGVELATVVLKNATGDQIVSGASADASGKFSIDNIKPGKYLLEAAFVGYNPKVMPIKLSADMQLKAIKLSSSSETLNAAVIVADRSPIIKTAEKTTFNVAQSPTNQTGTAEDLLRNIPGVSVDQDGNISITGKDGVKVLVDGRPNALAQSDLQGFLKSLPASSIESIEVINSPSARYDAEGNAGIINIILKKGKANGLNGTISAGYGILDRYTGSLVMNYRKNKVNVFGTYSINDAKNTNQWIEHRTLNVNDSTSHYNLDNHGTDQRLNNSLKLGFDYFIDDKTTFTYTASGNYSHSKNGSTGSSQSISSMLDTLEHYNSVNNQHGYNYSVTNDFAYRKKFDSTDHELDINVNHTYLQNGQHAMLSSYAYDTSDNYDAVNSLFRRTTSGSYIHDINFQLDYIRPLKRLKGYKIETGVKSSTTLNCSVFNVYNTINNVETKDTLLSNNFNYTQNISSVYALLRGTFKKWLSFSGGLRGTYTYIKSNNNSVYQSYPGLFPSASANAAINDTQNVSLSYSRRVQRPQFRQINNTIIYLDQYTTWQGNPLIKPAYSDVISANYTIHIGKQMFSFDVGGNFQNGMFIQTSSVDSARITRQTVANGGINKMFNLSFYCKLHFTKWWDWQVYNNYSYKDYGFMPGVNLTSVSGSAYNLWSSTDFTFWKGMVFDVNGWFNSHGVNSQGVSLPVGVVNASLKKSFLKKNQLTVSIAANNIFNTMEWRWVNNTAGLETQGSWQNYNRFVMVTLTYKFGITDKSDEQKNPEENEQIGG